ncbi:MAG: acyl-CoA dehydrogenase [Conexibacter sp.]|nr:acyl-CoA dehydrogenase [Conexibacter sp.]
MQRTLFDDVHDDFRASVRGFLLQEAVPRREEWEKAGIIDRPFWKRAAAQGYVGFSAPEEYGGASIDDFRFNAVLDEEVIGTGTVGDGFSLTNDIVAPYLVELTTEEQRERWLPDFTSGDLVGAIAMSEPGAGSDLRGIASTATWQGDHWTLNGSKTFVTSGIQADLVIVAAQIRGYEREGLGLFCVRAEAPGFSRGRKLQKIGRLAQDTAELFFEDVAVGPEDVLGRPGDGLELLKRNLPQERLSMAVTAVANAERGLRMTIEYVTERKAFGSTLGALQGTRFALAELSTEVRAARAYVDRCIDAHTAGALSPAEAAGAKFLGTELEFKVLDRCVQLHGGYGFMEEYDIARMWRDARVQRIYGGANEVMLDIVGRSLGLR